MNIQNVQNQAFLERVQSKIMRKIEDEYYCGGSIFTSQEQLDQFKQLWSQKLKQQFVLQNQLQLKSEYKNSNDEQLPQKSPLNNDLSKKYGNNPRKILKTEQFGNEQINLQNKMIPDQKDSIISSPKDEIQSSKAQNKQMNKDANHSEQQKIQNMDSSDKKVKIDSIQNTMDNNKQEEGEEEIDFTQVLKSNGRNIKFESKKRNIENSDDSDDDCEDGTNKSDKSSNFSLNSEDLEDVSDQILDEGYFNEFDNYLIGYIGKERKTKKKCKEQNKPITCIDFQYLIGCINKQEVIIPSLRANFVDCRK